MPKVFPISVHKPTLVKISQTGIRRRSIWQFDLDLSKLDSYFVILNVQYVPKFMKIGLVLFPISYVVNAGNLATVTPGNLLCKYADDTYVIVPAANIQSRTAEIASIEQWAIANNLKLNRTKSVEITFLFKAF